MRDQDRKAADPIAAQAVQSSTIENPLKDKGMVQSLKKTTLNESDQLTSNQFITKPVMTGSPLAAYGDPSSKQSNLRQSHDRFGYNTRVYDDNKNK